MADIRLHIDDSGGDGRPVVLIHGWPQSAEASLPPRTLSGRPCRR